MHSLLPYARHACHISRATPANAETVYGLGANALDADAVLRIFEFKGRPLTDPLIVHVPSVDAAVACVHLSPNAAHVFRILAEKFWPGPLTIVARAQAHIPPTITANTVIYST